MGALHKVHICKANCVCFAHDVAWHCLMPKFFNVRLIRWGTITWKAWMKMSCAKCQDLKPMLDSLSCLPTTPAQTRRVITYGKEKKTEYWIIFSCRGGCDGSLMVKQTCIVHYNIGEPSLIERMALMDVNIYLS